MRPHTALLTVVLWFYDIAPAAAQRATADEMVRDPQISALVESVSVDTLRSYLTKLVSFGTRHTLSDTVSRTREIGAARRWIHEMFRGMSQNCGGCLEVEYEADFAANARTRGDTVRIVNVIARLPGRTDPNRLIIVEGHYDSCICSVDLTDGTSDAPGANDDGSGTVAVMELARVFSRVYRGGLAATVMFVTVAGEEQGCSARPKSRMRLPRAMMWRFMRRSPAILLATFMVRKAASIQHPFVCLPASRAMARHDSSPATLNGWARHTSTTSTYG